MYVTIGTLEAVEFAPLMPAPSVRDIEDIPAPMSDAGLHDGPLVVTASYRGHIMYLENGASVYRDNPQTGGGNGLLCLPNEPESCIINWRGEKFRAIVDFNSNVEPKAPQA
jgi:hypothetical protein